MILTAPVLSPTAAGSIVRVAGPLIVSVVILTPVPDAPVESLDAVMIPETLILVAVAIPNDGVTNTGLVANTAAPEPVSSVSAVAN